MCAEAALQLHAVGQHDPTRTITLRAQWMADATRRLRDLQQWVTVVVVDWDVFGREQALAAEEGLTTQQAPKAACRVDVIAVPHTHALPDPTRFMFTRDAAGTVDEFMKWLREAEQASILEMVPGPGIVGEEPWTNTYVRTSYQRGLTNARAELAAKGLDVPVSTVGGGRLGMDPFAAVMQQPFHAERLALMYQRVFTDLQGVTATMNAQIRTVLTQGILDGVGADELARRINNRIDKIGITRAKLIARTETVETYNQAALNEYQRAEQLIGEPVLVKWFTAMDERVRRVGMGRGNHRRRHGKVFTQLGGRSLLGDPNCRCALLPYVESVDGATKVVKAASYGGRR